MTHADPRSLRAALAAYETPSDRRSILEILITAVPLALFWALAFVSVKQGWWLGLLFSVPAAGLLVRLFMIQHDCGHHAFFRSKTANTWVGRILGVFTMTPYEYWRRTHAIHHATSGNLDRRWLGAIETLTLQEYRALPWLKRLGYRLYRHPVVMFGLGPPYMFVLQHRLPIGLMKEGWAWRSVMGNNLGLVLFMAPLMAVGGPTTFLLVHGPVMLFAAAAGVWLFYVQHQFEGAHWARDGDWSLEDAALRGSSHLALPAPLQWLTANIGAHHVHHAATRIPFYRLPSVVREQPAFRDAPRLGLRDTGQAVKLALWDETGRRLVTFREARAPA